MSKRLLSCLFWFDFVYLFVWRAEQSKVAKLVHSTHSHESFSFSFFFCSSLFYPFVNPPKHLNVSVCSELKEVASFKLQVFQFNIIKTLLP